MPRDTLSTDAMSEASRNRAEFSGHGKAKGAAGYRPGDEEHIECTLSGFGETLIVQKPEQGFEDIVIGASWDNIEVEQAKGLFGKFFKKVTRQGVDIDLGCLYELQDGSRGCLQAFGDMYGNYDNAPYIHLSGDERTGDKEGDDEGMHINGTQWSQIKRLVVYVYIYSGDFNWETIRPQVTIRIPSEQPLVITPAIKKTDLPICAVASIENEREAIKFTNFGEYFPGHAELDRAYGFGLSWDDGRK